MAIVLECDGCACRLDADQAEKHGRLAEVWYCAECAKVWREHEIAEHTRRLALVEEWEGWLARTRVVLRTRLKRLPDE